MYVFKLITRLYLIRGLSGLIALPATLHLRQEEVSPDLTVAVLPVIGALQRIIHFLLCLFLRVVGLSFV